jgi:hypothetical protein
MPGTLTSNALTVEVAVLAFRFQSPRDNAWMVDSEATTLQLFAEQFIRSSHCELRPLR